MSANETSKEPELNAPGAGLPLIQEWTLKHLVFPLLRRVMSDERALSAIEDEGDHILEIMNEIPIALRGQRVLIPRMTGIEDSSRYWSPHMVLDHILIVSMGVADLIARLQSGESIETVVSTADVKPQIIQCSDIESRFIQFVSNFTSDLKSTMSEPNTSRCHVHPWFGCLDVHGWVVMLAIHHRIHRKQLQKIRNHIYSVTAT